MSPAERGLFTFGSVEMRTANLATFIVSVALSLQNVLSAIKRIGRFVDRCYLLRFPVELGLSSQRLKLVASIGIYSLLYGKFFIRYAHESIFLEQSPSLRECQFRIHCAPDRKSRYFGRSLKPT